MNETERKQSSWSKSALLVSQIAMIYINAVYVYPGTESIVMCLIWQVIAASASGLFFGSPFMTKVVQGHAEMLKEETKESPWC